MTNLLPFILKLYIKMKKSVELHLKLIFKQNFQ